MSDAVALREWVILVKGIFGALGLQFKDAKCQCEPVQVKRHLGVVVDTRQCKFLVPPDKLAGVTARARQLRAQRYVVARDLARFCGHAISLYLAFPLARFFLMSLYAILRCKLFDYSQSVTANGR